jgi:hypothetical protein
VVVVSTMLVAARFGALATDQYRGREGNEPEGAHAQSA